MSLDRLVSDYATAQTRLATIMRDFAPERIDDTLAAMKVTAPRVLDEALAPSARAFAAAVVEDGHAIARHAVALVVAEVAAAREAVIASLIADKETLRGLVGDFMVRSRIARADANMTGL